MSPPPYVIAKAQVAAGMGHIFVYVLWTTTRNDNGPTLQSTGPRPAELTIPTMITFFLFLLLLQ
jgi:hypothetical protein